MPPTAYFSLHNVVLRHDIKDQGTVSEAFPHLIFNNFNSKLGGRVSRWYLVPSKQIIIYILDYKHLKIFISCTKRWFKASDDVREW